jgi:hypothetical protein
MNLVSQNHHKQISHEDKQRLAYHLWERANRPYGKDVDFWIEAEDQLEAELANLREAAPKRAKAETPAKRTKKTNGAGKKRAPHSKA